MAGPDDGLPTIALVTPSYNHAHLVEQTIRSVLDQGYPKLQYVVVDGGSEDGTIDILDRYRSRLHAAVSEPDRGPDDAINKGFALTDGAVMGWLNSDDTLLPGSLLLVGSLFRDFPEVRWLTGTYTAIDTLGRPAVVVGAPRWTRWHLLSPYAKRWIAQTSTFWRRDLWEQAGGRMGDIWGSGPERRFAPVYDFELWARFSRYADLQTIAAPIGCHRHIRGQGGGASAEAYRHACNHFEAVVRRRERPTGAREHAAALLANLSAPLGRFRLQAAEAAVAGAMGAPRLIVYDGPTYEFRRRERLELSRKLTRRLLRRHS